MFWAFASNFFLLFLFTHPASALPPSAPLPADKPLEFNERTKQWINLLHIKPRALFGPSRSLIDDLSFFIASEDPTEELLATIQAFKNGKLRCKYPARFEVLKEYHSFPDQDCPELDEWISLLGARSLTYAFPGSFINRPASMFGHTLLRIDGQTDLLSYAISFAAKTSPDENPVAYSMKGLFGGFDGYFSVRPYYEHVKTYSDRESRDIWEYPLSLSKEEITLLLYHLWELRDVSFQYFYLDENCSYHLLSLLEVVRPEVDLTSAFWLYAIPSDTLKRAVSAHGKDNQVVKRPSLFAKVKHKLSKLSPKQTDELKKFLDKPSDPKNLSDETLDTLLPLTEYKEFSGEVKFSLLIERAARDFVDNETAPMLSDDPLLSHGSLRVSSGLLHRDSETYTSLEIRPAYHDVTDSVTGFIPGAEISFFDTKLNWSEDGGVKLEDLTIIRILSLLPVDSLFAPFSWRASLEAKRSQFVFRPAPTLNVSLGCSVEVLERMSLYSFLRQDLVLSPQMKDNYNYLVGLEVGSTFYLGSYLSGRVFGSGQQSTFRDSYFYFQAGTELGVSLTSSLSLKLNLRRDVGRYVNNTSLNALIAAYF